MHNLGWVVVGVVALPFVIIMGTIVMYMLLLAYGLAVEIVYHSFGKQPPEWTKRIYR